MKQGTDGLLKFKQLASDLGLRVWECRGLLDTLWEFTGRDAPSGDIGKFTDEEIALAIDYQDDAKELIAALKRRKWVDQDEEHRLLIHDWPDHCEENVHTKLARERLWFANGSAPRVRGLHSDERGAAQKFYESGRGRPRKPKKQKDLRLPYNSPDVPGSVQGPPLVPCLAEPSRAEPCLAMPSRAEGKSKDSTDSTVGIGPHAPPGAEPRAAESLADVSARLVRLGMNPTSADRLAAAGITPERAAVVIAECERDSSAKKPIALAVKKLAEECGARLLNGKHRPIAGALESAVEQIGKLRANRAGG